MAIQEQNIKLNIVPGGIIPIVNVSQFDVGRVLTFTIYDGNNPAVIPNGTTVSIEGLKPSNKAFTYNATISGNIVTVSTLQQMTIEGGAVACKLKLLNGGQNIGTAMFTMQVEVAGVTDGADTSETVLPAYMEAGRQNALNAEAWAKGTKNGVAVGSGEPQYHNNAKYWSTVAETSGNGWVNTLNNTGQTWKNTLDTTGQQWSDLTKGYMNEAHTSANNAAASATQSRQYSDQALENAENGRKWAKSWAVYSNNPDRYGNDFDNSQYWCDLSHHYLDKTKKLYDNMTEKFQTMRKLIEMIIGDINILTESGDSLITQSGDDLIISWLEENYLITEDGDNLLTQHGVRLMVTN